MADTDAADPRAVAAKGLRALRNGLHPGDLRGRAAAAADRELMGFRGVSAEPGRAVFEMEPGPQHYNPIGSVHGGVALTLLDSAMGCAVHTLLERGRRLHDARGQDELRPPDQGRHGRHPLRGIVIHQGSRVATAEGKLTDTDGKLLAHGTTTCLIFR